MVRITILEGGKDNTLWPEVVFAISYIKNLYLIQALERSISPTEIQDKDFPNKDLSNLYHLHVISLTVYVFLHEKECILKLDK